MKYRHAASSVKLSKTTAIKSIVFLMELRRPSISSMKQSIYAICLTFFAQVCWSSKWFIWQSNIVRIVQLQNTNRIGVFCFSVIFSFYWIQYYELKKGKNIFFQLRNIKTYHFSSIIAFVRAKKRLSKEGAYHVLFLSSAFLIWF